MPIKFPKIFYGWWVIAACFTIAVYTGGVVVYGFTAFFDPIIVEFGWTYAQVSLAASLRGVETGLVAPAMGFIVDRWGSRWLLMAGAILTGVGLILLSRVQSLAAFYGAFILVSCSMSCCGVSVITPVANHWFRRNLGKAMSILAAGFAMGGLMVPIVIQIINAFGWRDTLVILGIGCFVICIPLTLIIKHKPEQYGYVQDGAPAPASAADSAEGSPVKKRPEINIGVGQALKSRTFWHLTMAFTLQYIIVGAILAHIMPFLNTVNIDRVHASFFAGAIPVLSIVGRLMAGWFSDKFNRKKVAVASFAGVCISTLMFDYITSAALWLLVLTIVFFSLSYGCANTTRSVLMSEYFGRSRFGTIFGFMMGILTLGAVLGPVLAGWTFDIFQSYHYAWIIFTVMNVASLIILATTPRVTAREAVRPSLQQF
jgi:sugar phosphate permease